MALLKTTVVPPEVILELFSGKLIPFTKMPGLFPGLGLMGASQRPIISVNNYMKSSFYTINEVDLFR